MSDFNRIDPQALDRYITGNYGEDSYDGVEPCCVCGKPSDQVYADNEDLPWCGSAACGLELQRGLDYHEEVGNR